MHKNQWLQQFVTLVSSRADFPTKANKLRSLAGLRSVSTASISGGAWPDGSFGLVHLISPATAAQFEQTGPHPWQQQRREMAKVTREWFPPGAGEKKTELMLYNSLLDEKVPFIPAAGAHSKQITWYTCGPTVYDSAHLGHARNYLTFDILRRVLEDYFGYNVLFVMNVTDVDDKIILRARRNFLVKQYHDQNVDNVEQVCRVCCICIQGCRCGAPHAQSYHAVCMQRCASN